MSRGSAAMRRPLVIVGAGGFARETAEAARAQNADGPRWELVGFLDDDPRLAETQFDDLPVLGPVRDLERYPSALVAVCVTNPQDYSARLRIVRRIGLPAERSATIVHPSAILPGSVALGPGSVVLAGVVATTQVRIGAHVAVMPGVVLTHDDRVEDFATLASGVRLGGGVHVGRGAYLGAGSLVRERRSIGSWSMVGMGAVVLDDVPAAEVWVGVPARRLRAAAPPPEDPEDLDPSAAGPPNLGRRGGNGS